MASGSVNITQGLDTPIRTVQNTGVDGGARQQVATLGGTDGSFLDSSNIPNENQDALLTRNMPQQVSRMGFSLATASGADTTYWRTVVIGSGQTASQSGGNLNIATGTTANSETIIRSLTNDIGAIRARIRAYMSQRIANQSFFAELVDVIGDALAITINSATSVTVTMPTATTFSSGNVGQSMYLGAYSGTGTFIPGRYTIASVSGAQVTYTVSGFAAGSGTCSVFGWNYHHLLWDGTSATSTKWDTQRKGYNTGDTAITGVMSTASPGAISAIYQNDMQATYMDALTSSPYTFYNFRGSRVENVPDDAVLYFQLRAVNGSTAPASSTTWTVGQVSVANWAPQDVAIQDVRPIGTMSPLPVALPNGASVTFANPLSPYALETANQVYANNIRPATAKLYELTVFNSSSSPVYLKVYNKASAPAVASDTPIVTFVIAAGADRAIEFGTNGKYFSLGLGFALTGAASKTDSTAVAAGIQFSATYG